MSSMPSPTMGGSFAGSPCKHPYDMYLAISQIEHRRIEPSSPESNGFCERFHRTVKEEFFAVAFRQDALRERGAACRQIWTATSSSTIGSGRPKATAPRDAHRIRRS